MTRTDPGAGAAKGWLTVAVVTAALLLGGCNRDLSPPDDLDQTSTKGPPREREAPPEERLFGEMSVGRLLDGKLFDRDEGDKLPVNRYLWQASLETLDFLPLASTDPFTGVIATDWSSTPEAPNERFKVTAYMTSPELEASSLKVAVYRQVRGPDGSWQPAPVSPETPLRLENAILERARQIRIAEIQSGTG